MCVPVVLAYNLSHYESLHPVNSSDIQKTCELVEQYLTGNWSFKKADLPILIRIDERKAASETREDFMKDEDERQATKGYE